MLLCDISSGLHCLPMYLFAGIKDKKAKIAVNKKKLIILLLREFNELVFPNCQCMRVTFSRIRKRQFENAKEIKA